MAYMRKFLEIAVITAVLLSVSCNRKEEIPREVPEKPVEAKKIEVTKENFIACVIKNDAEGVAQLLEAGIDAATEDDQYRSAFWLAATKGHSEIMQLLIDAGANPNSTNNPDGWPVLMSLVKDDERELVEKLIAVGADVNAKATNGMPVLVQAVQSGNSDIVTLLLDAGADVNAKTGRGMTVLMHAVQFGNSEAVKALLNAEAEVNAQAEDGSTALSLAKKSTDDEKFSLIAEMLVRAGAK